MSINVILTDKDGNQVAPATTATQAKYDANSTVKDKIDELIARASIFEIDSINIVAQLPVNLTEKAMYLIPIIDRFVPSIPSDTGYSKAIITCNVNDALVNEAYKTATEFYLICGDVATTSPIDESVLSYTNSTSSYVTYPKVYKYTVGGAFNWVEMENLPSAWGKTDVLPHKITNVIYASDTIISYFQSHVKYVTTSNVLNADGSLINAPMPTTFDSYFVLDGVLYQRGTSDLSYIINNLFKMVKPLSVSANGTYTADNINAWGYSPIEVNVSSN